MIIIYNLFKYLIINNLRCQWFWEGFEAAPDRRAALGQPFGRG